MTETDVTYELMSTIILQAPNFAFGIVAFFFLFRVTMRLINHIENHCDCDSKRQTANDD